MFKISCILGVLASTLIFGCDAKLNQELNDEYIIKGTVEGLEKDTWVYLSLIGKAVDSTKISAGEFSFEGKISHPTEFQLFIKNPQNFISIWLEPGMLGFRAKNGEFHDAIITGSKTQKENEILDALIEDYRTHRDSLTSILRNSNSNDSIKKSARGALQIVWDNHLDLEQEFIKNNPKSYVSVGLIDFYSTTFGRTKTQDLFRLLNDSIRNSSYGQSIKRYLDLNRSPEVGEKYVDFSMADETGKLIAISDFDGKLVLLDFWASWCGPCIEEYPTLRKAYSKYKNYGFEIVSISEDQTRERWIKAISDNELNWVNLWDKDGSRSDPYLIYGISGIPDNFLFDESGIIIARNLRGEDLISTIEEYFRNKASR